MVAFSIRSEPFVVVGVYVRVKYKHAKLATAVDLLLYVLRHNVCFHRLLVKKLLKVCVKGVGQIHQTDVKLRDGLFSLH